LIYVEVEIRPHPQRQFTAWLPALGLRESPDPLQNIPEQPENLVFRCPIREVPRRIQTLGGVVTIRIASAFSNTLV